MKKEDLKQLSKDELLKRQTEARIELMKLRSQVATGTNPKNPHQIKQLKKILASIKAMETNAKQ